ncbi:hypothetical protein QVD17_38770 [Tagetes erecta]|uniref:ADP-ribosylation factor n=1 Tax=Tagetes erecta TaxID=13708 RepID=A0AAD8JPG8_TARER|nr:hypothetical protein QVD17_38770 [Tagetes erecta]
MCILMVGLDAAGKTTILYKLKLREIVTAIPLFYPLMLKLIAWNGSLCVHLHILTMNLSLLDTYIIGPTNEAYTGSTIRNGGVDFDSEESNTMTSNPLFLELLTDESDGLVVLVSHARDVEAIKVDVKLRNKDLKVDSYRIKGSDG